MIDGKFYAIGRLGSREDQFTGYFSGTATSGRYAFAVGTPDQPLSRQWSESLVQTFIHFQYPVENSRDILYKFLSESRERWMRDTNWSEMKWYTRNKSLAGVSSAFSGIHARYRDDGVTFSGFSSGIDSCFALNGFELLYHSCLSGNKGGTFWSGYLPPFPASYGWNYEGGFYFGGHVPTGTAILIVTPAISKWILSDPEQNSGVLSNNRNPDALIRNMMKSGKILNQEGVIIRLEV